MYRLLLTVAVIAMLIGTAILGYAIYVAVHPLPATCAADGTGCGTPTLTPQN